MSDYPKLVHWQYWDGIPFFGKKKEKEVLTCVYVNSKEGEEIAEKGYTQVLNLSSVNDPYFTITRKTGFTSRARNHGNLRRNMEKDFPDLKNKLKKASNSLVLDYGEYIYTGLPHLSNYVNSLTDTCDYAFFNKNFIKKEYFNADFIKILVDFKPLAAFGGTIASYTTEEIPKFLTELSLKFPDIYQEYNKLVGNKEKIEINYVGKEAKLMTLNHGVVQYKYSLLNDYEFHWDGEFLTRKEELRDGSILEYKIQPHKETIVTILDNSLVNENTILAN